MTNVATRDAIDKLEFLVETSRAEERLRIAYERAKEQKSSMFDGVAEVIGRLDDSDGTVALEVDGITFDDIRAVFYVVTIKRKFISLFGLDDDGKKYRAEMVDGKVVYTVES